MNEATGQAQWMTVTQLAERWKPMSYDTILRAVNESVIPCLKIRGTKLIAVSAVKKMEAAAQTFEASDGIKKMRKCAAWIARGKDHFPDCQ